MNFNYSYRAFLITSLLTGILVLFLFSIKLSKVPAESNEETYDVVMAPETPIEDKDVASLANEKVKVETNRAYNEAEKFITSVENENRELTETTEGKLEEMEEAMDNSQKSPQGDRTSEIAKPNKKKETKFSNSDSNHDQQAIVKGGNKNTTISYRLVGRKDLFLPNPVYTCYGAGRVVVNIEVDNLGKVKKGLYNKAASTTANECLIDAAIEYALQAEFTSEASRGKQLGTITFNFPGQN